MDNKLEKFWMWLGKSPEEYALEGMNQKNGEFEDEYPEFEKLLFYARKIVDSNKVDCSSIDELITIMALDNESESILDYIEERSSSEQLIKIIERGVSHLQPNARWQVAELIFRRFSPNYVDYLTQLSNDKHLYVKKRALNCLECIKNSH